MELAALPVGTPLDAERSVMAAPGESIPKSVPPPGARGAPEGEVLLSVSHLTKSYGARRAVSNVSLEATTGITGLLGPNGAGKTTRMRCIAGLAGWDAGEVRIGGVDLARRPGEARHLIGFMPERVAFPAEMRVEEYLRFVAEVKRVPRSQRAEKIGSALVRAGLEAVRRRIVGNLSKGYRQRVGLAQALLADASVVLLDEPSAGLDPLNVMELREVLRECARDRMVLVSTHLLPEARLMCDRVIVMSNGIVVYDGPTAGMVSAGRPGARGCPPEKKKIQVRIRVRSQDGDRQQEMVVDAESEAGVGARVGELVAAGWSVVGVEPTTDALEEAFRNAVVGAGQPPGAER
jgi:ABC-2 type transport system ATP-binding protein